MKLCLLRLNEVNVCGWEHSIKRTCPSVEVVSSLVEAALSSLKSAVGLVEVCRLSLISHLTTQLSWACPSSALERGRQGELLHMSIAS